MSSQTQIAAFLSLVLVLASTSVLSGCAYRSAASGSAPSLVADLPYVTGSNTASHRLDLYLPAPSPAQMSPLIIWIHGGAWMGGDKRPAPVAEFLKRGYAVASINYRLSQEAPFPAQIHDCKAAIRFLRKNAAKFNLDPQRFGVFGFSAGGHLATLLGTTNGERSMEGQIGELDQSSDVQAVCDWSGITDMFAVKKKAYEPLDSAFRRLLNGDPEKKKDLARMASSVSFVSSGDPPFLIMHGNCDKVVPIAQSRQFNECLRKAGVSATYNEVEGGEHDFLRADTIKTVADFFDDKLRTPTRL